MITVTGLGSGLDIEGLVTSLVEAERAAPELRLAEQESIAQAELSAFGQLNSALSDFQSSIASLADSSLYSAVRASSGDVNSIYASATSAASEGSYDLEVTQLASSHSLASGGFADSDSTAIGTGTLTIRLGNTDYDSDGDIYNGFTLNGDQQILSLDIDSSNNTLQGISDAINAADAGVSASVVNDGGGYRLLLTSQFTGEENSLEISVTDDDGNDADTAGLSQLAFNSSATNMEQTAAAADALFKINGLTISSSENQVNDALEGVTLDLKAVTSAPVSITVERDLATIESAVLGFVTAFNQLQDTFTGVAGYDSASGTGGLLQGDFTVGAIENGIKGILRGTPEGVNGELQRLSQIGISTNADGSLSLDTAVLNSALQDDLQGVSALFTALGVPSSESVTFLSSSENTEVGDYAVFITQAATQGQLAGANVLPDFAGGGSITIDGDNDSLGVTLDGVDLGAITLTHGTYTSGASLAAELQARINSAATEQSSPGRVTVSYSAATDSLTLSSDSYGSESAVDFTSIDLNTAATLGLSPGTGTQGTDVAGTINGQPATGTGRVLTAEGDSGAAGLSLEIAAGISGDLGTVSFGRGLFDLLGSSLDQYLADGGLLDNRTDGLESEIEGIYEEREDLDARMIVIEERYRAQFTALDTLLAELQATSDFLTQQLAILPGASSSSAA